MNAMIRTAHRAANAALSTNADVDSVDSVDPFFSVRRRRPIRNHDLPALLDHEAWEVPFRLSEDGLYAEAGAHRRMGGHPAEGRDDER